MTAAVLIQTHSFNNAFLLFNSKLDMSFFFNILTILFRNRKYKNVIFNINLNASDLEFHRVSQGINNFIAFLIIRINCRYGVRKNVTIFKNCFAIIGKQLL